VEGGGPGPVLVDAEMFAAAAAGESGGDVQQAVAQRLRFGDGDRGLVCEQRGLGPGDQVDRGQRACQPRLVDRELPGWEMADAGVFPAADPVLDAGVGAVPGIEPVVLPDRGARRERGVAVAVGGFEQVELRPGVGCSRRTMTRIPAGYFASVAAGSSPVSSATPAPSRGSLLASIAGVQARAGSARIASRSRSVIAQPTLKSAATKDSSSPPMCASSAWEEPAPSPGSGSDTRTGSRRGSVRAPRHRP